MAEFPKPESVSQLRDRDDSGVVPGDLDEVSTSAATEDPADPAESTPSQPLQSKSASGSSSVVVGLGNTQLFPGEPLSRHQNLRENGNKEDSQKDGETTNDHLPQSTVGTGVDIPTLIVTPSALAANAPSHGAGLLISQITNASQGPRQQLELLKQEHKRLLSAEKEAKKNADYGVSAILECIDLVISKIANQEATPDQDSADSESGMLQEYFSFRQQLQAERKSRYDGLSQQMKDLDLEDSQKEKIRDQSQATDTEHDTQQMAIAKGT